MRDAQPALRRQRTKREGESASTLEAVKKYVDGALARLIKDDAFLFDADVHERTISGTLARYLAPFFSDYAVDPEYNRHGLDIKVLRLPRECRGGGNKRVVPDIVVHRRGDDSENLLVIQVKKGTNREPRECDRAIIRAMKRQYKYRYGLFIDFPAGAGARAGSYELEWY